MPKHRMDLANQVDQSKKVKRLRARCSQLEARCEQLEDKLARKQKALEEALDLAWEFAPIDVFAAEVIIKRIRKENGIREFEQE